MRSLLLVLTLGFAACAAVKPTSDNAPSFRETRAVCRAVAEGRVEFLDIASGGAGAHREEEEWSSVDVDDDGTPEDVAILYGGSSGTPGIEVRAGNDGAYIESFYDEAEGSFAPWRGQLLLTRNNGRVYEVFYSDDATTDYPVYVAIHLPGGEGRWLCAFQSAAPPPRLTPPRDDAAPVCAAVERHDAGTSAAMTRDDRHVGGAYFVRAEAPVDFMNDGRPREVLRVHRAWSGGAGCDTEYYALAEGIDPHAEPESAEAIALADLQTMNRDNLPVRLANHYGACHGNIARFHHIDGAVVFEQRFPEGARNATTTNSGGSRV